MAARIAAPACSVGSDTGSPRSTSGSPVSANKLTEEAATPDEPAVTITPAAAAARLVRNGSTAGHGHMMLPLVASGRPSGRDYYHEYEFSDLDAITVRQLNEDICAYDYDLEYCKAQLEDAELTPQEMRTLQLRTLDLGHQIRHCKHRIETIKAQTRKSPHAHPHAFRPANSSAGPMAFAGNGHHGSGSNQSRAMGSSNSTLGIGLSPGRRAMDMPAATPVVKRSLMGEDDGGSSAKRVKMASPDLDIIGGVRGVGGSFGGGGLDEDGNVNTALQRLGFWRCRLCSAPKYLLAGAGRTPAAPCKWPLKDISKMITHFTEMHAEHTPAERCVELGAALAQNRAYPSPHSPLHVDAEAELAISHLARRPV